MMTVTAKYSEILRSFSALIVCLFAGEYINVYGQAVQLHSQAGHHEAINSVSFSRDGRYMVTGAGDDEGISAGLRAGGIVAIWDLLTGTELRSIKAHDREVIHVAFSPDGGTILSAGRDSTIRIWDAKTGDLLKTFTELGDEEFLVTDLSGVELTPDGRAFAVCNSRNAIHLFDIGSGKLIRSFRGHNYYLHNFRFSGNGAVLVSNDSETIKFWDVASGKETGSLMLSGDRIDAIAVSTDGQVIAEARNKNIIIRDRVTAREITRAVSTNDIRTIAFHPNGETLYFGGIRGSEEKYHATYAWNFKLDDEVRQLAGSRGEFAFVTTVAVAPNASSLVSANKIGEIRVWDARSLNEVLFIRGNSGDGYFPILSSDGKSFAWVNGEHIETSSNRIKVWSPESGTLNSLQHQWRSGHLVDFSPSGRIIAWANNIRWASSEKKINFIDVSTGTAFSTALFKQPIDNLNAIKWSPNGDLLAVASDGDVGSTTLYHLPQSKEQHRLAFPSHSVGFSPDGSLVAAGGYRAVQVWNTVTGAAAQSIELDSHLFNRIDLLVFSRDGNSILAISSPTRSAVICDLATGKTLRTYESVGSDVERELEQVFGSVGGDKISEDAGVRMRIEKNGAVQLLDGSRELVSVRAIGDDDWVAWTPTGIFDGTPNAFKQLIWRFDNNTFNYAPVEAFFKEFYRPGLLQEVMAGKVIEPPKTDLASVDIRQADVRIELVDGRKAETGSVGQAAKFAETANREVEVAVELTDNTKDKRRPTHDASSGAKDLRLFRAGSLVKKWAGDVFDKGSGCEQVQVKPGEPRKAICKTRVTLTAGDNQFTAYAFNSQNVKSTDATAMVRGADALKRGGTFYIFAVGVDKYANAENDLKYAVADVDKIGRELAEQQVNLKKYARAEVIRLTNQSATKANILLALERFAKGGEAALIPESVRAELSKINKAQPEDAILFHFSGHGTARCQLDLKSNKKNCDRFYLLPHDGFENNYANGISDEDLEATFEPIDAGKLLMVIDACNSGQALEAEEKRRGPMNSRGLAQLAFEKGMMILTASQSQQAALETNRLGHGLLTYSLLQGLQSADKSTSGEVIDRSWFNFAAAEVPKLQLDEMKKRDASAAATANTKGAKLFFRPGDDPNLPPEKRGLQSPRIFYRREADNSPFVVARPERSSTPR